MKSSYVLVALPLLLLGSPASYALNTCTIESFQSIDIEPSTTAAKVDRKNDQIQIKRKPPMRCATITFTTSTTRNRVGHQMANHFEATFIDNTVSTSHSISFDEDDLKAGYIRVGPNTPAEAYVCFSTAGTPIADISCDVQ
ncbi:hypothetical protein AKJ18_14525 [Vibrio xuii]|nr:hypothetical protein AKJ18_14525 [Vibrio xuii]